MTSENAASIPLEDRPGIGARGHPGVAGEVARRDLGLGGGPGRAAVGELLVGEPDGEDAVGDIDVDDVAVFQEPDRPADGGLGADVADRCAGGAAGESAVGDQGTLSPRPTPLIAVVGASISCMPGPPLGPS